MTDQKKLKFLICGHSRHGKDTLCEILSDEFGLTFSSSSWFMRRHVWGWLEGEGVSYPSPDAAYEDRHRYREVWHDAIEAFNTPDKDRLTREILKESDVYCGMRNAEEFRVSRRHFDLAVWVNASERVPPESGESNSITAQMCDVTIDNSGDESILRTRVLNLFSLFGLPRVVRLNQQITEPVCGFTLPEGEPLLTHMQTVTCTLGNTYLETQHKASGRRILARPEWLDLV